MKIKLIKMSPRYLILILAILSYSNNMNAQTVSIASSAISNTTCAGDAVTFTANLTGYTSPSYQWYKNNVAISGATSATYTTSTLINNDVIKAAVVEGAANVSTSNLVLNLDAGNSSSYTGSTTTWTDLTGRGNNGTISSGITYNAANGGYFQFPNTGSNGVILPASSNDFNFTTSDFAVELWVNAYNNYGRLISLNTKSDISSTALTIYPISGSTNPIYAGSLSTTGFTWSVWHHVIYTRISGVLYLYIDGVLKSSATDATSSPSNGATTSNTLGSFVSTSTYLSYTGKMSIARVYKDAGLTSTQVVNNYNAICSRYGLTAIGNTSNGITTTVNPSPSTPTLTVSGDACINKTTLSATSGVYSYTWAKDNVTISGATGNTYTPTLAGDYKVAISNGTCSNTSTTTTIYTCGVTPDGKMGAFSTSIVLVNKEGAINSGGGIDERGLILNIPGTVVIGTQRWKDVNLDISTYRNGDNITYAADATAWNNATNAGTGVWCYYNFDPANNAVYGKLYNWYAVNDSRGLAPLGYHVPTETEWETFYSYLGGDGGKIKTTGTSLWAFPNTGATNSSGFNGLPGGYTYSGSFYSTATAVGYWWSASQFSSSRAWTYNVSKDDTNIRKSDNDKNFGFSVRLIKD
jgi:uncharacterized protein (TIGR02145 family)